ncbi:MAG TPA: carboxypeptidase regulatory-like domain-containing protein [Candidatus Latescibacteria bacterium]|nr:carboxypeptidase regulatory-like domain-containing protein [Candidatus Latescibacterota bacterium]
MPRSMSSYQRWFVAAGIAFLSAVSLLRAGTTGKITGIVRDQSGQPLPGVAVQISGLRLGGVTDADGRYFILQVPPGTHEVQANMVGYRTSITRDVLVGADRTTTLNFTLREETIEVEAVVVTAGRPPIEVDVTSSQTTVNSARVAEVPVNQMLDVLAYEPGVSIARDNELNIRGGGATQIRFQVDGLDRTDGLTNKPYTQLNQTLVAEVTLLTGGFNAEYGNVRSGMVNVVTKAGNERGPNRGWVSGVYSMTPTARKKHFGPGGYSEDQFDYRTALLSDANTVGATGAADPYGAIYWPNLYESTRTDTAFRRVWTAAPNTYKVFDGWASRVTNANATNRGAGVYGKGTRTKPWTADQIIEAWRYEANLNENVWGYSHEPDWSLDLSAGWGLPRKLGGIVIGYVTNKEMTITPALRPYYRDETFDVKLTLTPVDRLKWSFSYMHGTGVSTGNGTSSYDPEMAETAGSIGIGGDAVSLRTAGDLLGTVYMSKGSYGNNRLNLSYNSFLDATFWQWGTALTYTISPATFATAAFGQTHTEYELVRDWPRADISDFSTTGTYKPSSTFSYRAWLQMFALSWSDVNGDGRGDLPNDLNDALTPGRAFLEYPYGFPSAYKSVPSQTVYVNRQFVFAPGDTARVVSPQGWVQEGYYDLSGTFWLGEGGQQYMTSHAVQTAARADITHAMGSHTLKTGAEYLLADLEYHAEEASRIIGSRSNSNYRDYGGKFPASQPSILGIFLQDKFESQGMVMNFGLRAERFDGGAPVFMPDMIYDTRLFSPNNGKYWFDSLCVANGWNVNDPAWGALPGSIGEAWSKFEKNGILDKFPMPYDVVAALPQRPAKAHWRLAPRFGISHPVSVRTKFFFNYGIFYSMAKPAQMYGLGEHDGRTGALGRFEQLYYPELRPAKTTMYEVGFEQVLPFSFVFKTTGYAKYNVDQVTGVQIHAGATDSYRTYRNANYQDIRGLEMKLARNGRFVSGWATYQIIATRSGQTGLTDLYQNPTMNVYYTPLVTTNSPANNIAASVRVGTPVEWGLLTGGWGASIIGRYNENTGEVIYNPNNQPRRELPPEWIMRGRDYWGADLKFTKDVAIGRQRRASVYLDVTNFLNRKYLNGTYMNGNDYLAYVVERRAQGEKDLRVGDPSTWDALTQPYRIRKADGTYTQWKAPISPRTDWIMFLYPRAYRAGIRFDL